MTRRHFEAIAKILNDLRNEFTTPDEQGAVSIIAEELADFFEDDNDRFDRDRFIAAVRA